MQDAVTVVTAEVIDDASAPSPPPVVPRAAAIRAGDPARLRQRQPVTRRWAAALLRLPPVLAGR
jgi:hypothetical protein